MRRLVRRARDLAADLGGSPRRISAAAVDNGERGAGKRRWAGVRTARVFCRLAPVQARIADYTAPGKKFNGWVGPTATEQAH
jgi:hypothetical protein